MSSDSAKGMSTCLAFGRAACSQKSRFREGMRFKKLAHSDPSMGTGETICGQQSTQPVKVVTGV